MPKIRHSSTYGNGSMKAQPFCSGGNHYIQDADHFYTINPEGGYGLGEVLCCETCIKKSENLWFRHRMIVAGAEELEG